LPSASAVSSNAVEENRLSADAQFFSAGCYGFYPFKRLNYTFKGTNIKDFLGKQRETYTPQGVSNSPASVHELQ